MLREELRRDIFYDSFRALEILQGSHSSSFGPVMRYWLVRPDMQITVSQRSQSIKYG